MAEQRNPNYEPSQPPVKPVLTIGIAFMVTFVAMAFVSIGVIVLFTRLDTAPPPTTRPLAQSWQMQPSPQLVETQGMFLAPLRASEDIKLNNYGWINQPAGVARIPIETAMELVLADLPVRGDEPPAPPASPTVEDTPAGAVPGATDDDSESGAAAPTAGETNPAGDSEAPNR